MNLLIITLCILISAETEILLATDSSTIMRSRNRLDTYSSSILYPNQLAGAYPEAYPGGYAEEYPGSLMLPPISQMQPPISQSSTPLAVPPMSLYNYNYNTDTGIQAQEEGYLKNVGTNQEALEAQGSYRYTDNKGNTFQVSYVANENGFQPKVIYLPTNHH